jgi:hypothetical protein
MRLKKFRVFYTLNGEYRLGMDTVVTAISSNRAVKKFEKKYPLYDPVFVAELGGGYEIQCEPFKSGKKLVLKIIIDYQNK